MTKEEIIKTVCKYDFIESIELNDDITVSEALEAMQLYADQQTAEKDEEIGELKDKLERKVNELVDTYTDNCSKDKRIRELEEAAKNYINKLEDELTYQAVEGVSLDVDGLNIAFRKWGEVLTKINQTNVK